MAHRGIRGIAVLFLDYDTRWGEGSASGRSLPSGKTRYPLYRRLGGPQDRSGEVRKISPPTGFDTRTVQPVVSRYTDWATGPTHITSGVWWIIGGGINSDLRKFLSYVRLSGTEILRKSETACLDYLLSIPDVDYWLQSRHVSGIFMPIIRGKDHVLLHMGYICW